MDYLDFCSASAIERPARDAKLTLPGDLLESSYYVSHPRLLSAFIGGSTWN